MLSFIYDWIIFLFALFGMISAGTYIIPFIWDATKKEQNLQKKYSAKWALVTGGSSGIGKSIVLKLAKQGINVVNVAIEDELLKKMEIQMKTDFPQIEYRSVGVNLGKEGYMQTIKEKTNDIDINLIFNNAGYLLFGLFSDLSLEKQLCNVEVNAIAPMKITHHFVGKLLERKQKGAVIFTSSPTGKLPNPTSILYGATKQFLTSFGASLAAELKDDQIDVLVMHPSPVNTNFFKGENLEKNGALQFFKTLSVSPDLIAEAMFSSVGNNCIVRDQGIITMFMNLLSKLLEFNTLALVFSKLAKIMPEYRELKKQRNQSQKKEN